MPPGFVNIYVVNQKVPLENFKYDEEVRVLSK